MAMSDKQLAKSKYIKEILLDVEQAYVESYSLNEVIELSSASEDQRFQFYAHLDAAEFTEAQTLIDGYFGNPELDAFPSIASILLERKLANEEGELNSNQFDELEEISLSNKKGKYLAQSLLGIYNEVYFDHEIVLPSSNKSLSSNKNEKILIDLFDVYPNPANDFAYFTFNVPEQVENAYLTIYDNQGKSIEQVDLTQFIKVYRCDVSHFSKGNYNVTFVVDGRLISSKKLVIL